MDLGSGLIFIAVAVAWAAYLIPLAVRHHDEADRTRSIERFSHRLRVLARREPVDKRSARLVVKPGSPASAAQPVEEPSAPEPAPVVELTPAQRRARRAAAQRATKRRRNVLALLLLANVVVATLAGFRVHSWWYVAIPGGLLVAWLVLCRVMVRGEQAALRPQAAKTPKTSKEPKTPKASTTAPEKAAEPASEVVEEAPGEVTEEIAVVVEAQADVPVTADVPTDPTLWDPVPVTLPTYVSKPAAARRTVRQIELDDTGVWTSGRSEADSKIAREAEAADRAEKAKRADGDDRAVGT